MSELGATMRWHALLSIGLAARTLEASSPLRQLCLEAVLLKAPALLRRLGKPLAGLRIFIRSQHLHSTSSSVLPFGSGLPIDECCACM